MISGIVQQKRRQHIKLTPFLLKLFAITTITKCEHQAIKLTDHTHDHEADIAKVQEWLGHASIATTRIYDRRKMRPEDSLTFKVAY